MNRLDLLRNNMDNKGIDVCLVPMGDYHQSEYACEYFELIEYFTGFTGSAGTLVVTKDDAYFFTDGRYFIQADLQLDKCIKLMRMGVKDVPTVDKLIGSLLKSGMTLGFDGKVVSYSLGKRICKELAEGVKVSFDFCPEEGIWENRPHLPKDKVFILEDKYCGENAVSKIKRVREKMSEAGADCHVISSLDDIAWILNIRGNDIKYNPVVMSYLIVDENRVVLYSDMSKYDNTICEYLNSIDFTLKAYDEFYNDINQIKGKNVLIDGRRVNYYISEVLSSNNKCIYKQNPSIMLKAVKNKTEIDNLKKAHVKDGIAVTKFIIWIKEEVKKRTVTEYEASQVLTRLRSEQEGYIEDSFETIAAYGANAAQMHYSATSDKTDVIENKGMLLVDSGGQYYEGTTDVTRTFAVGPVTDEEKKYFTLVLKGMLNLTHAKFLYGCIGQNLDILARGPLWDLGVDYRCGTGHGVSYLLGVHEAPNGFRWRSVAEREDACVIEEGMVSSNEPGVYFEGKFGIRTENEMVCVKDVETEYGQFMSFDTLTLVPIDTDLVDKSFLSPIDIERLNDYNTLVMNILLPHLNKKEQEWLRKNVKMLH